MWKLSILLVAVAICAAKGQEEVKHNLPEGLEIIDPKSLGLSDSDVEKFLGNVKLLPVGGGDMGNNVKTQILTVGFDGDEKLDLADFDGINTAGLPDKDKEVAQAAFQRFQEFFKKPGSSVDFDKVIQDSENSAEKSTYQTTITRQPETTTTPFTEGVTNYREEQRSNTQTTIQAPFRSTGPTIQPTQPQYDVNAEEVINLLKIGNNNNNRQKFGGFLSSNTIQTGTSQSPDNQQYQTQSTTSEEQVYTKSQENAERLEQQNFVIQQQQRQQQQQTQQPQQIQIPINPPPRNFIPPNQGFGGQMILGAPLLIPQQQVFLQPTQQQFSSQRPNQVTQLPPQQIQNFRQSSIPPQQNSQFQQQNFPPPSPVHSHFQPPEEFSKNFIPVHAPQQHSSSPSTPRPGFSVTPSGPMIPLSTIENAINRPPVVPQHLHNNHHQQHQDLRNGNKNSEQISHQDIVAQIAREQHQRIAQQPAQVPTHPPSKGQQQNQQQNQQHQQHHSSSQHQGREISQEPLKNQQQSFPPPPQQFNPNQHGQSHQINYQQQQQPPRNPPPPPTQRPTFLQQNFNNNQQSRFPPPSQNSQQPRQNSGFSSQPQQRPQQQQNFQQPPPPRPQQSFQSQNFQRPPPYTPQFRQPNQQPNFPPHNRFQSHSTSGSSNSQNFQQRPPPPSNNFGPRPQQNNGLSQSSPRPTPVSHSFFPPPRQNVLFKDPNNRFNNNNQFQNNRPPPPPPHRPPTNPGFNPSSNLIPVDQPIIKGNTNSRFPSRPDPASFSSTSSSSSVNRPSSFPPLRGQVPPPRYTSFGERPPLHDDSQRGPRHFTNFGFGPSPYSQGSSSSSNTFSSRPAPPFFNQHSHDLNVDGSEQHTSLAITRDLFKPDFIHSIQPSKMVAYKYISSGEN